MYIILSGWVSTCYFTRGEFYREKAKDYVSAAISMGQSNIKVMFKHILPNALTPVITFAPFAIIGSIGVLVQLPNFHRVLKKYDVDYEMISAGEYKRTLSHFGEITAKGKDKVQEDVENIHNIFKAWVKTYRPSVEIDSIATGETWVGTQAKDRYMVDEIKTSDEVVIEAFESSEVYEIEFEIKKSLQVRLASLLEESANRLLNRWFGKSNNDIYQ